MTDTTAAPPPMKRRKDADGSITYWLKDYNPCRVKKLSGGRYMLVYDMSYWIERIKR